jgi:GH25 family lysozyme M1 (1,4-beta-N-acetylmuramidase)
MIRGVDINTDPQFQGQPDWAAVKGAGYELGIVKVSEGVTWDAPGLGQAWRGVKDAGLTFRGAYHLARVQNDPLAEAHHFLTRLQAVGGVAPDDLPPALDLEFDHGRTPDEIIRWTRTWCLTVERETGRIPMMYTYPSFWQSSVGDTNAFTRNPLWISHTGVPTPWSGPWGGYHIWQNGQGQVPGIRANLVDLNVADEARIRSIVASSGDPGRIRAAAGFMARQGSGGWVVAGDGGVFGFGDTPFFGSLGGNGVAHPVVGGAPTPSGDGYWLVGSDGGVFSFGDATFHGSIADITLGAPIAGMASTPDGGGYWLVGSDGGVFAFGNAAFAGSLAGSPIAAPVVDIAPTPGGYLLAAADGGVFAFGTGFFGSLSGVQLNAPVVAIVATPSGGGYWLAAADGGLFAFGDAPFRGTFPGLLQEYAGGQRRIIGASFLGDHSDVSTWGYNLFSDRLPVERYQFGP